MVVIAGTDTPARHRLLDSWAGRLLRSGAGAHDVVRSPLDAVRAGAGILVAALAWWVTKERGGSGWSLTWQWVELALVVVALLGTAGTGLVVVVLALSRRRWSLSALALVAIIACVLLVLGTVHGSAAAATIGWTASVAATAALWPSGLSGLRRAFLVGVLAGVALVLAYTDVSFAAVVATAALGYAAGCTWRLVVGRDVAAVTDSEARALAAELGVQVVTVERAPAGRHRVAERFLGRTPTGAVEIWVYQRSSVDTQLLARLLRFFWYRNARMPVALTRMQHVEHHVALVLLGSSAGATDTAVVAYGLAGAADDAVVITTWDDADLLTDLDPAVLDPAVLDSLWGTVRGLADVGIAHGHLDTRLLAWNGSRWFVRGLPGGSLGAPDADIAADSAALLVATAQCAGASAAVAAAVRALTTEQLTQILPLLQTAALPSTLRQGRRSALLGELRAAVAVAAAVETVDLAAVHRIQLSSVLMAAGTLLGLWLLIGEFSGFTDLWSTLLTASWAWIACAFVLELVTNLTEAIALSGAVATRLRIAPLVMLRLADGFFGLVGGTVAMTAAAVRYFQKQGLGARSPSARGSSTASRGSSCRWWSPPSRSCSPGAPSRWPLPSPAKARPRARAAAATTCSCCCSALSS